MLRNVVNFIYETRLFYAVYASIAFHIVIFIFAYNQSETIYQPIYCGPYWIYANGEVADRPLELDLEFAKRAWEENRLNKEGLIQEEGQETTDGEPGEKGKSESFAKGKYEGGQWENLVKDLESASRLRDGFKNDYDNVYSFSDVSDSYIRRERDYEDIVVKEVFPTLKTIRDPFTVDIEEADDNLAVHKERNRIIEEFRKGEEQSIVTITVASEGENPPKSPLSMPKEERSDYLDQTLKQSKEKQLDQFISRFMGYDPDKGDLAKFVRDLYYENLQRLAYVFSGDPSYFTVDYFQENLNKEDFLRQMMALLSENLGTKVGTEVLFTLDNIYFIQARALKVLMEGEALYASASDEQKNKLRMEIIKRVSEKYRPLLKEKNIRSYADVENAYSKKRLEIMDTLIKNSPAGYRLNDAHFEKGKILWDSGMFRGEDRLLFSAIEEWKKINPKSKEGDFLAAKSYDSLGIILQQEDVKDMYGKFSPAAKDRINYVMTHHLEEEINLKRQREEKLLWPKVKSKPN